MKSQISRHSFDRNKRYSGVYQQQGRMLTDADWNEQVEITKERLNEVLGHVIGSGTPEGEALVVPSNGTSTIDIQPGYVYVDGIIARVMPADSSIAFDYANQADFPTPPPLPTDSGNYALYVDIWERPVTSLEDEGQLRDAALRGADTTTRTRTMAQIKWCEEPGGANANTPEDPSLNPLKGDSQLTLAVPTEGGGSAATTDDPCGDITPFEGVSGNYLFRVEVHDLTIDSASGEIASLTLKWSGENGAEQFKVGADNGAEELPVDDVPEWFKKGHWIYEFFNDDTEMWLGVHHADDFPEQSKKAVLTIDFSSLVDGSLPYVRRWDGYCILEKKNGVWSITEGRDKNTDLSPVDPPPPIDGNTLQHQLDPFVLTLTLNKTFVVGDYWQVPVRERLSPGVEILKAQEPHGIEHHYLKLADFTLADDGKFRVTPYTDDDSCRHGFPSLTNLKAESVAYDDTTSDTNLHLPAAEDVQEAITQLRENHALYYVGGDGQEAMPGEMLPQPLAVRVMNGQWPVENATVTVRITAGTGMLSEDALFNVTDGTSGTDMTLETNSDGFAEFFWQLDTDTRSQTVAVTLAGADHEPLIFTANLSIADEVAYDDTTSDTNLHLPAAEDVQEAITQLRENNALYYVGGDGQEAMPGQTLPHPLAVRVMNGRWPVVNATIKVQVTRGIGTVTADTTFNPDPSTGGTSGTDMTLETNSDGFAEFSWQLDTDTKSQTVAVTLAGADHEPLIFTANLSIAKEVAFDPTTGAEQILTDSQVVPTVQKALEELDRGKVNRSGDTITGDLTVQGNLGVGTPSPGEKLFVDGDVRIQGDLSIDGDPTQIERTQVLVEDNILTVNKFEGDDPNPTLTAGLEVFRGSEPLAQLLWDETEDFWKIGIEGNLKEVATVDQLPSGVARTIYQQTHDFEVGDAIYFDAATLSYAKATASDREKTGLFLVSETGVDPDAADGQNHYFTLVQAGYVDGLESLTDADGNALVPGEYYYVSDHPAQAGSLTPVEPLKISNPIFLADSDHSGYVLPYRPGESIQHVPHALRVLEADPEAPDGALFVDQAGHLGIGTLSPSHGRLQIKADSADAGGGITLFQDSGSTARSYLKPDGGNDFNWHLTRAGNHSRGIVIDKDGNVGIGTSIAKNKLDVEGGTVIGSGYSGSHEAPSEGLLVQGNVGIGTDNPGAKLEVDGTVQASAFVGDGSSLSGITTARAHQALANNPVEISSIDNITRWMEMPEISMTVSTAGTHALIFFNAGGVQAHVTMPVHAEFRILLDGGQIAYCMQEFHNNGWELRNVTLMRKVDLLPGPHTVKVQWSVRSPNAHAAITTLGIPEARVKLRACWYSDDRSLMVLEL